MKTILMVVLLSFTLIGHAQQFPNNQFLKWNEWGCPEQWNCNNDEDCREKVSKADKQFGGVMLEVKHCFDPKKVDRSNNVNLSYDDLTAIIKRGKKVSVRFQYSYTPQSSDRAYIKIDIDFDEEVNNAYPIFLYNNSKSGYLKPGSKQWFDCKLNFDPNGNLLVAPIDCHANSIRTSFGIVPGENETDVHKGSQLIIHQITFIIE